MSAATEVVPNTKKTKVYDNEIETYYITNTDGSLKTKAPTWSVCVPSADRTLDPLTRKPVYNPLDVKTIVFNSGVYETKDQLEKEFLEMYNDGGELTNGKKVQPNNVTWVVKQKDFLKEQIKEVETIKEVVIEVVPMSIMNKLPIKDLQDFAKEKDVPEASAAGLTKEEILKILKDKGVVSDNK